MLGRIVQLAGGAGFPGPGNECLSVTADGNAKLEFGRRRRPSHPVNGMSFIAWQEPKKSTSSEINRKRHSCLA